MSHNFVTYYLANTFEVLAGKYFYILEIGQINSNYGVNSGKVCTFSVLWNNVDCASKIQMYLYIVNVYVFDKKCIIGIIQE